MRSLVLASLFFLAGCVVVPLGPPRPARSPLAGSPACKESQYWDGAMCRHKGKGHGARKHDG